MAIILSSESDLRHFYKKILANQDILFISSEVNLDITLNIS